MRKISFDSTFSKEQIQNYQKYVDSFESKTFYILDSLTQRFNHTFKKYDEKNTSFVVLPMIKLPSKNDTRAILKVHISINYNTSLIKLSELTWFNMGISKEAIDENDTKYIMPHFTSVFSNTYQLYIPEIKPNINDKIIKNEDKNQLNILFVNNSKKDGIFYNVIANLFCQRQYTGAKYNLFLDKKNAKKYKDIVKVSYKIEQKNDDYILNLSFKGKNILLKFPSGEPLKLDFKFNKKRFDSGDFSEFGFLVMPTISSFITLNK